MVILTVVCADDTVGRTSIAASRNADRIEAMVRILRLPVMSCLVLCRRSARERRTSDAAESAGNRQTTISIARFSTSDSPAASYSGTIRAERITPTPALSCFGTKTLSGELTPRQLQWRPVKNLFGDEVLTSVQRHIHVLKPDRQRLVLKK